MSRGDQRSNGIDHRLIRPDTRNSLAEFDVGDDEIGSIDDPAAELHDADEIPSTVGRAIACDRRHLDHRLGRELIDP